MSEAFNQRDYLEPDSQQMSSREYFEISIFTNKVLLYALNSEKAVIEWEECMKDAGLSLAVEFKSPCG